MTSRALWNGAISFGLVHIPVALHAATLSSGIEFEWLDRRTLDPVGYRRINKKTGEEITGDNVVKGMARDNGQHVVLSEEEIRAAYPKITQTIEIEGFVAGTDIPLVYLERPYYLAPVGKSAKVYALLRESLLETGLVGIARVVIQTRQHLAALMPTRTGLVLNLLRWEQDIRPMEDLALPPAGAEAAGLADRELAMARQLVQNMAFAFEPAKFADSFRQDIMALVERKERDGNLNILVLPEDGAAAPDGSEPAASLVDLLQRSLRTKPRSKPAKAPAK